MKAEQIIEILETPPIGSMNAREIAEKLEGDYESTRKMLQRMEKKGILKGVNDWCQETNGYPKYYSMAKHKPVINPDTIVKEMVKYCNEVKHPALASLPTKYGGEQTGGSGHLSAWKGAVEILVEMGKL